MLGHASRAWALFPEGLALASLGFGEATPRTECELVAVVDGVTGPKRGPRALAELEAGLPSNVNKADLAGYFEP